MIDLHAHILPGLDDGPGSLEEAVALARSAVQDGIEVMVATPHFIPGVYNNNRENVLAGVEALQAALAGTNIPLALKAGLEAYLDPGLVLLARRGELLTINDGGRYLLVELPQATVPDYAGEVFFRLQLTGITPVIAHPERNRQIIKEPGILHDFLLKGVLVQLTAAGLNGSFGSTAKKAAELFLKLGWVHFLSSDAHDSIESNSGLKAAFHAAARLIGEEGARRLVSDNPRKVLQGELIETGDYEEFKPPARKFLNLFAGNIYRKKRS